MKKLQKQLRTRQLQLSDKVAIKPKPMDFPTSGTWNTGEGTGHGPDHNQFIPWGKTQKLSHRQILFLLMLSPLGEEEFILFNFQTFVTIKKYYCKHTADFSLFLSFLIIYFFVYVVLCLLQGTRFF